MTKNWKHISYEKIAENENKWSVTEADYRKFNKCDWVVTEKIHGANFCILSDGKEVICAKRKKILAEGDDFFGYRKVLKYIKPTVLKVYKFLHTKNSAIREISVYGEIFGGTYNHPNVEKIPDTFPVQTGVEYSPNIEFMAFDIAYSTAKEREYLGWNSFIEVAQQSKLPYCKPLFKGKYKKALEFNERFESKIYLNFELPKIANNFAEGIVIKPTQSMYVNTKKGTSRVILKKKIAEFAENKKFHGAKKQQSSNIWEIWKYSVEAMLTDNRIESAISKIGSINRQDQQQVSQLCEFIMADIIDELDIDTKQDELMANINQETLNYIYSYFQGK